MHESFVPVLLASGNGIQNHAVLVVANAASAQRVAGNTWEHQLESIAQTGEESSVIMERTATSARASGQIAVSVNEVVRSVRYLAGIRRLGAGSLEQWPVSVANGVGGRRQKFLAAPRSRREIEGVGAAPCRLCMTGGLDKRRRLA